MRVNEVIMHDKSAFLIYVTQQEHDDPSFQTTLDGYKKDCNDVSVFINESLPICEMLKKFIQQYQH
ncbi:hypothetical protein LGL08_11270 [Clostridium estertheticum]|uniref:hypothetical protein n=1 Tax=Clostridium estertheticum TaxID=238834 RepID=UPI001CF233BE|nr:hypothetical protein [Clostridium estertheticum]MCB2306510.1 hypothetical protein [Clostridium estertheticum]MCB2345098.1 hypothetical protein [Clostridium estertheticum]MCB2350128.1 hypothetical protein [Clostridium estertheticum]WAG44280.1 hypothetical protein LL127_11920 [Clostridium estertheticum]